MNLVKTQIPLRYCAGYSSYALNLFGDNRGLRFSVRIASVVRTFLFYLHFKKGDFIMNKVVNKILAILLFPLVWILMYLCRIIWYDLILSILQGIMLFPLNKLGAIWTFITTPFVLLVDIVVGLFVTLVGAVIMCAGVFTNKYDIYDLIRSIFQAGAQLS